MRILRVALAQVNTTVGDLPGNTAKIIEWTQRARALGADLVAFPELAVTGYPPEDLVLRRSFIEDNLAALDEIARATTGIVSIVGFVDANDDIYNAAAVISGGKLVHRYHKQFLPNYGVFDEDRYFQRGFESPVFVIAGVDVGVNICEDIWYTEGPTRDQAHAGAEVVVNINGSPYSRAKGTFREGMISTRANDNGVVVCYVNAVGGQDELVFDGHSVIYDETGRLVARAAQFREELLVYDIDVEGVMQTRLHDPRHRKERLAVRQAGPPRKVPVSDAPLAPDRPAISPAVAPLLDPIAEVYDALVLGVRDYIRKTGFETVLVGLSGGVDSSLVAVIAADALGPEHVVGVSMPSRFSSEGSKTDAQALAGRLGIRCLTIPIEGAFTASLDMLAGSFQDTQFGVAEENLQARIRGNVLMSLSNKFGWMALTTGNKSEMATGYSTLYGDMAGGFAVIKDVPKTLVWDLARHRNRSAGRDIIPRAVIDKPPSAELRAEQLDTDTLPPYDVLDPILQAYVEDDRSVAEIVAAGYDAALVQRIVKMVDRNEYKRRQAPPGIKITPRAFGRDRRLPIANRYRPR
ncbi:MAG TPA: NAD+ synthase [Dehalococcoidia bacterium]|nr:NAD+ synthase [Dehalococcoidia bacterium]